ncbi:MAG: hypothetical protein VKM97_05395 [Cyanobacteriota bacterium]|nr:hypothetical protein [Cyanobacteriota bacterium]
MPLDDNHPVLIAMEARLAELQRAYDAHPNEFTRYQLARLESLIRQWSPDWRPVRVPAA